MDEGMISYEVWPIGTFNEMEHQYTSMISLYFIHLCFSTWNGRHKVVCVVVVCLLLDVVCFECISSAGVSWKLDMYPKKLTQCTSTQASIPNKSYLEVLLGRTSLTISGNLVVSWHTLVGPDLNVIFVWGQVMWHQAAKRTPIHRKDQCTGTRHDQRARACLAMGRAWNDSSLKVLDLRKSKWLSLSKGFHKRKNRLSTTILLSGMECW